MLAIVATLTAIGSISAQPEVSATQFGAIIKAAHADLHDVWLIYEGETTWTGPANDHASTTMNKTFQGNYAYRADGAIYIDTYVRNQNPRIALNRWSEALFKQKLEELYWTPDVDGSRVPIRSSEGNQASFNGPESAHQFFYVPFFASIADPDGQGYKFHGWESLDNRRCLVVQLNFTPGSRVSEKDRLSLKFWIDVERNAQPIKVECYRGSDLIALRDEVALAEIRSRGSDVRVWLPVRGVSKGLFWENRRHREPVYRIAMAVVNGSIVLNGGLPDRLFSLAEVGRAARVPELKSLRGRLDGLPLKKDFDERVKSAPGATAIDRESVVQRLNEMLQDADRQAAMLEASSWSRQGWLSHVLVSLGFCLLGGIALVFALFKGWARLRRST